MGRAVELGAIHEMFDRIPRAGGPMLLTGDAGIGKSSLLSAAREEADRRGFTVLTTSGSQVEADLSFAGLHFLLRPVLDRSAELPDPQRNALLVAFGLEEGPPPERFLLALAALELLAVAAARCPILVIIEDVHWLDRASAEVLAFVARRLGSEPIVLLAASRLGPEFWPADATLPAVRVEPLDDASAEILLERSSDSGRGLQRRILALASGNPLALVELPRALEGRPLSSDIDDPRGIPLNARLEGAFAARTVGLTSETRTILLVTALGEDLEIADVLRAASAVAAGEIGEQHVAPAVDVGLLDVRDGRLRFRHPLMRSAIQGQAGPPACRSAHSALSVVLGDQPERAVWHRAYASVATDEGLAEELAAAAAVALRRGALAEAVRRLERASQLSVDEDRRLPWILDAAELAAQLNDRELADRLLGQIAPPGSDVRHRARSERVRETFAQISDTDEPRIRQLLTLADACAVEGEPDLALDLLLAAALRCFWAQPEHAVRVAVTESAQAVGVPPGNPKLLAVLGVADPVGARAVVSEHITAVSTAPVGATEDARLLGMAAFAIGDSAAALRLTAEAADALRAEGRLGLLALTQIICAWSAIVRGELDLGLAAADEGRRLALESGQWSWAAAAYNGVAVVTGIRGEAAETARLVAEGAERIERMPRLLATGMAFALGVAELGAGRAEEAYAILEQLMVPPDPAYPLREFQGVLGYVTEAMIALDRLDEFRSRAESFGLEAGKDPALADRPGEALGLAILADEDAAFASALTAVSSTFERARIQQARGVRLLRERQLVAAREPLRSARDAFDRVGVARWAEAARQQLQAAGEASNTRRERARDALTPQELEIAALAAAGLSNKDIGRQLYLSHRTVGGHLYRVFPKLGITSRAQLSELFESENAAREE